MTIPIETLIAALTPVVRAAGAAISADNGDEDISPAVGAALDDLAVALNAIPPTIYVALFGDE